VVNLFDTPGKAEGYAKARPPLHARIVERIAVSATSVLDVGCGAGLSTAPLLRLASRVAGIEPAVEMLHWARRVAPGAHFLSARSESLPFRGGAFDLITAAGSLNYADPAAAFPELRRVLTASGSLVVYDFAQAGVPYERAPDGSRLLTPEILGQVQTAFRVARAEALELPVSMTHEQYVAYLKTEVEAPVPAFQERWDLLFRGYIAWLTPASL
jgi:ubiquinone/menaquinone biosynthesis C-methylase UbiE